MRHTLATALLCLLIAAPAAAVDLGPPTPTLEAARADIAAEHWDDAVEKLRLIVDANNTNADAYSLLGYTLRHTGATGRALQAYERALKLEPQHTGALEYQGELFLILGEPDKAKANLALIETICGTGCEPYVDLAAAIAAGKPPATKANWG